ncbi:gamma-tubulin complex, DGRIP91/SPC98 component protein [Lyophyllum atratum]|nr:gamma-tubulin complex, DGRIP91/SPC98 component protein [Lyophyllum atratum]
MFHRYSSALATFLTDGYAPLEPANPQDDLQLPPMNLPPLPPHFFVPPLSDKPQNPIMDTLKQDAERYEKPPLPYLPPELSLLVMDPPAESRALGLSYDLWADALTRDLGIRNKALSWDRLRPSHPNKASSTGFLSEQDSLIFAAARYHVNLRLRDPSVDMVYVTQNNLLKALKMTILGTSSMYHTWDASAERFVQAGLDDGQRGVLLMDGKDEVISQSLTSRFLTIGTLLRRVETLLQTLRTRSSREGPTVHAYAHALSTITTFLRQALARGPPVNDPLSMQHTLSAIWMHYEIYEEILVALADLCGRDETQSPDAYPASDLSPVVLLSSIYSHLGRHLERQSPRVMIAIFAYMLTHVSHEYIQQVSRSVGYRADPTKKASRSTGGKLDQHLFDEEEEEEQDGELSDARERLGDTFPDFFPPELLNILPAAQRSLTLLEAASPHHPILQRTMTQGAIRWFWTETLIEAAWKGQYSNVDGTGEPSDALAPELIVADGGNSDPEFSVFKLFDLEPGANIGSSTALAKAQTTTQSLQTFIDEFPASLPPLTPTLTHLTSLVLAPLLQHASTLSTALLTLFLSPSPSNPSDTLSFQAHLVLLRSYLLLTAPPFKSRLAAALFSDQGDCDYDHDHTPRAMSIRSLRRKTSSKKANANAGGGGAERSQPWAVGLAPSLLEREMWPPVGADLSFFLRTVIVDSFENEKWGEGGGEKARSRVLEEAEYRLGFAIRDLPVGSGRDKWLNPLSIEALDFLYMDYKPPSPIEVLVTPDILSKYQRMFAFILRLMRVEHALGSLFRMTRGSSKPLFPTLVTPRRHLLHFRFVAQSFVSSLSAYVFDTAIGGNFDPFLARLSSRKEDVGFSDVFALAKSHSKLLDDMLSACLLRSGQRAVGELLRNALELILEYTVVVGELHRGRMEEYQAAPLLEDISKKFFGRMTTLTKVLKGLVDKNGSLASAIPLQGSQPGVEVTRKPTGGADALYHLLIRLDLGEWWAKSNR